MLIQCDARALEWRVICWLANDPIGILELNEYDDNPKDKTKDIHTKNQTAFKLPERVIAKRFLFRAIYRGSGYAYSLDPDFVHVSKDPDFWDKLIEEFYRKYRGIDKCHTQWGQRVTARKPLVSPLGREWMITLREDGSIPWTVLTNYPVQGTGHDLLTIARISLHSRLRKSAPSAKLISTVHDSIVVDAEDKDVPVVVNTMYDVFDDIPKNIEKLWKIRLPLKFPGEVSIGPNLRDMKEVDRF